MELEFMTGNKESLNCFPAVDGVPVPSIGDTLDLYVDGGTCAYVCITGRKLRFNPENQLYKITFYCKDLSVAG